MSPNDLVFASFCVYIVCGAIISVSGTSTAWRSLKMWIVSSRSPCHTLRHAKRYVETPIQNDYVIYMKWTKRDVSCPILWKCSISIAIDKCLGDREMGR